MESVIKRKFEITTEYSTLIDYVKTDFLKG